MYDDLIYGGGIIAGVTTILFLVGIVTGSRVSLRASILLLSIALAMFAVYLLFLWDDILLANLLPFSNLIVVGNWLPPLSGFVAGLAWKSMPGSLARRTSYAVVLLAVGTLAMLEPIYGSPPACDDVWIGRLCIQTSKQTCSAACAATLLRAHGIGVSEGEMADLCLTRSTGTTWQGLYRGLKLQTREHNLDVEVLPCTADDLFYLEGTALILVVGLPSDFPEHTIYTEQYGWGRGESHSVVFFGFDDQGLAMIGDPDAGEELWTVEDLRVLVRGRAIRLVKKR